MNIALMPAAKFRLARHKSLCYKGIIGMKKMVKRPHQGRRQEWRAENEGA